MLIGEELCWGCSGIATSIIANILGALPMLIAGTEEQQREWLPPLLDEPILRPELEWERRGDVDDVVFVQGAVPRPDGTIYLTYGAADRCVGAATVDTATLVDTLLSAA